MFYILGNHLTNQKPVLIDVDETYNTSLEIIKIQTKKTKAIMSIYLYGRILEDIFR